ncbi:unnamed protein product [Mycena citricolor]|uniref:Uncharacterized protein n=1 Tax=Mycena citricolor TaxID=2018698 RepID=A0AAD2JUT5_9AGAR|nr:unnamed protein product [Mycena citricolor]
MCSEIGSRKACLEYARASRSGTRAASVKLNMTMTSVGKADHDRWLMIAVSDRPELAARVHDDRCPLVPLSRSLLIRTSHAAAALIGMELGPEASKFLELPDEILLLILGDTDLERDASLLGLASLCRRLHFIALPIYLAAHGIADPAKFAAVTIDVQTGKDTLLGLQRALYLSDVEQLEISCFLPPGVEPDISMILRHFHRLNRCVEQLKSVRRIVFDLNIPEKENADRLDTGDFVCWAEALTVVLCSMLNARLGCTELTVRGGEFFAEAWKELEVEPAHRPILLRPISKVLSRDSDGWDSNRWRIGSNQFVSVDLLEEWTALRSFSIESSILLINPFLVWTLSALRLSRITTFQLRGIRLDCATWSQVLRALAASIPVATSVVFIDLYGISGADILHFLEKIGRQLRRLTLGYTEYSFRVQSSCPDSAPCPKMPLLERLHAPLPFVTHFLKKAVNVESLKTLRVSPRMLISRRFGGMRHAGKTVLAVLDHLRKRKALHKVQIELEMHCGPKAAWASAMESDLLDPFPAEMTDALSAVRRLVLLGDWDTVRPDLNLDILARWITQFSGVTQMSLRPESDAKRPQKATAAWASASNARLLCARNPNVELLELDGNIFDTRLASFKQATGT